jgi:hypothetical protein
MSSGRATRGLVAWREHYLDDVAADLTLDALGEIR